MSCSAAPSGLVTTAMRAESAAARACAPARAGRRPRDAVALSRAPCASSPSPSASIARDGELHLAARRDRRSSCPNAATCMPSSGARGNAALVARPHDAADLRRCVAQAEVPVAVAMRLEVADLAAHPERDERALDDVVRRLRQHRHGDRRLRGSRPGSRIGCGDRCDRAADGYSRGARRPAERRCAPSRSSTSAPSAASHAARRARQASPRLLLRGATVLRSSIAIVICPTPPGTGVISDATSRALVEVDVADQPRAALLRRVGNAIHADVDHHGARLHHVAR